MKKGIKEGQIGDGSKHISALISDTTYRRLRVLAELEGKSLTELIQVGLDQYVERNWKKGKIFFS